MTLISTTDPISPASPAHTSTLVTIETVFCDVETVTGRIEEYFQRYRSTLRSILAQDIPDGVDVLHTVYVSSDKLHIARRIEAEVAAVGAPAGLRVSVFIYTHPTGGYGHLSTSHVDMAMAPNKQWPRREAMSRRAHENVHLAGYDLVVRMGIDDDDVFAPWHIRNVLGVATDLLDRSTDPTEVLAVGLERCYLIRADPDGHLVRDVDFIRCMSGNKFFAHRGGAVFDPWQQSVWSLPETFDTGRAETFRRMGTTLTRVRGNQPSFGYVRRGRNLSVSDKDAYVQLEHGRFVTTPGVDFIGQCPQPSSVGTTTGTELLPAELTVTARRLESGAIKYATNARYTHGPDAAVAYYFLKGNDRVHAVPYSRTHIGEVQLDDERVRVKVFVRLGDRVVATKTTGYTV